MQAGMHLLLRLSLERLCVCHFRPGQQLQVRSRLDVVLRAKVLERLLLEVIELVLDLEETRLKGLRARVLVVERFHAETVVRESVCPQEAKRLECK